MKQRIPVTPQNLDIVQQQYGLREEELNLEYWARQIVNNEQEMSRIFQRHEKWPAKGVTARIQTRARKLLKRRVLQALGLPKKGGTAQRQREWHRRLQETGLDLSAIKGNPGGYW